jgi:hypothetical protein
VKKRKLNRNGKRKTQSEARQTKRLKKDTEEEGGDVWYK